MSSALLLHLPQQLFQRTNFYHPLLVVTHPELLPLNPFPQEGLVQVESIRPLLGGSWKLNLLHFMKRLFHRCHPQERKMTALSLKCDTPPSVIASSSSCSDAL